MPRVIGIDPGKTTGICSFYVEDPKDHPACLESYELGFQGAGQYLENHLGSYQTIVICEAFLITTATAKKSFAPWSLEVIGLTKFFCAKVGVPLFMYAPATHKRLVSNDVLKRVHLFVPGEHARDAARIGVYHCLTQLSLLQYALKEEDPNGAGNEGEGQGDR